MAIAASASVYETNLTGQPIVFPAPETVAELYELAIMGDVNELVKRVSALAQSDSRLRPFTVRIQRSLTHYQLDEIGEWLAPHRADRQHSAEKEI